MNHLLKVLKRPSSVALIAGLVMLAGALLTLPWVANINHYLSTSMVHTTATVVSHRYDYRAGTVPILQYVDNEEQSHETADFEGYALRLGAARGAFALPLGPVPNVGDKIDLYYEKSDPTIITTFSSPIMKAVYFLPMFIAIDILFVAFLAVILVKFFKWLSRQSRGPK
jgi:hypothetical protein